MDWWQISKLLGDKSQNYLVTNLKSWSGIEHKSLRCCPGICCTRSALSDRGWRQRRSAWHCAPRSTVCTALCTALYSLHCTVGHIALGNWHWPMYYYYTILYTLHCPLHYVALYTLHFTQQHSALSPSAECCSYHWPSCHGVFYSYYKCLTDRGCLLLGYFYSAPLFLLLCYYSSSIPPLLLCLCPPPLTSPHYHLLISIILQPYPPLPLPHTLSLALCSVL